MIRFLGLTGFLMLLGACVSTQPDRLDTASSIAAKTDGATCAQLQQNMKEALAARSAAKNQQMAGETASGVGSLLSSLAPMAVDLTSSFALVNGGTSVAFDAMDDNERAIQLYEQSYRSYEQKGCRPKIVYGQ